MPRMLSLYLPTWPVDLIRRRLARQSQNFEPREAHGKGQPPAMLLVEHRANQQRLVYCCPRAAASGVRAGMSLAHARALLPSDQVRVFPSDPKRQQEALGALAQWAIRFSPVVAADGTDGLLLDVTGCQRLFRGERRLVHQLVDAVRRLGFAVRAASAPSVGCAWAVARFAAEPLSIIEQDQIRDVLGPLPTAGLRLDAGIQAALAQVGIERVGDLFRIPRRVMPSRFGPELLQRIDQATGDAIETIAGLRTAAPPQVQRLFAGPVKQWDAIELTVRQLVDQLANQLAKREAAAQRIEVELVRYEAEPVHLITTLSRPSRNPKHLWTLLRPQLEKANLGHGVERIRAVAPRFQTLAHEQNNYLYHDQTNAGNTLGELIDLLTNRLGPQRVVRTEPTETHIPELVYRQRSAVTWSQVQAGSTTGGLHKKKDQGQTKTSPLGEACGGNSGGGGVRIVDEDRPSVLLDPPDPVDVIAAVPDGPPVQLRWRHCEHRLVASIGPERIAPQWWKDRSDGGGTRDYFKVQNHHGQWLWIYRDHKTKQWFVHGEWS